MLLSIILLTSYVAICSYRLIYSQYFCHYSHFQGKEFWHLRISAEMCNLLVMLRDGLDILKLNRNYLAIERSDISLWIYWLLDTAMNYIACANSYPHNYCCICIHVLLANQSFSDLRNSVVSWGKFFRLWKTKSLTE